MSLTNDQFQQLLHEYNAAHDRNDTANGDRYLEQIQQFLNEKCNLEQISYETMDNRQNGQDLSQDLT